MYSFLFFTKFETYDQMVDTFNEGAKLFEGKDVDFHIVECVGCTRNTCRHMHLPSELVNLCLPQSSLPGEICSDTQLIVQIEGLEAASEAQAWQQVTKYFGADTQKYTPT